MTMTTKKLADYARNGLTRMLFPTPFRDPLYFETAAGLGSLKRALVWWLPPTRLKSRYLELKASCRVVEVPFALTRLRASAGARILDFGCATSRTALELASLGFRVTGVDYRRYPVPHPNLETYAGDFLDMPAPSEGFDAVLAISAVEHSGLDVYGAEVDESADRKVVLRFREMLKPGGQLLLTVPYGRPGRNSWQRVYGAASLRALIEGFVVEEERYYLGAGRRDWREVSAEALVGVDSTVDTQGVAALSLRRPA